MMVALRLCHPERSRETRCKAIMLTLRQAQGDTH